MKVKTAYTLFTAILCWFGLLLQLYLILTNDTSGVSFWGRFFNFFSFFTILTNILVAVSLTCTLMKSRGRSGVFFTKPEVQTASAVYILIVGIIYVTVLQRLWKPQGLQWLADIILHYAIPALYTIYWLTIVPKGHSKWKHCFRWLIYPALYFAYSIVRGAVTGWYPYPFLNVKQNGFNNTLLNAVAILGFFIIVGFIFIGIDKYFARTKVAAETA